MKRITQRTIDVAPHYPIKLKKNILNVGPQVCDANILLVITGSAEEQSDETGTSGNHFYFKARKGTSSLHLWASPLVRRRLVLSRLLLTVGERGLLVARGAAAAGVRPRWVWGGVIIGWIPVFLVKFSDPLTIPSICKVGQNCLWKNTNVQVAI